MNSITEISCPEAEREDTIRDIARRIGDLSVSIGGIWGDVDDCTRQLQAQNGLLKQVSGHSETMTGQAEEVLHAAQDALAQSDQVGAQADHTLESVADMFNQVNALVDVVGTFGTQLSGLETTLKQVSKATSDVGTISRQTDLLALNAAIEAARAGRHGEGFMVVANEVKSLSEAVGQATRDIGDTVSELTIELQALMRQVQGALDMAGGIRQNTDSIRTEVREMPGSLRRVAETQRGIADKSTRITEMLKAVRGDIGSLSSGVDTTAQSIASVRDKMLEVTDGSEALTGMTARLGVETVDTPYIATVTELAARISKRFEAAVSNGEITMGALFDTRYQPIPGTDPEQVMTRYVDFTDRVLPEFQEPALALSEQVVFCAAVDTNGFLPTHNRKFSHPPRPDDPEWNKANCRNRRIFGDRVGLAAGQSTRHFLMQAYRRDMGNGQHVLMKDLSAPIYVQGRHWGGLRLAYKV